MNSKIQTSGNFRDTALWLLVAIIVAGGIYANFYFANAYSVAIRLVGWIVLAAVLLGIVLQTKFGQTSWTFVKEARMELRKVTWPTRQETVQTTMIVIAMVVVVALLLWGIDTFLLWGIGILTGHTG